MSLYSQLQERAAGNKPVGKLLPAPTSLQTRGLPRGLAHNVRLLRAVKRGQTLSWDDVAMNLITQAYHGRREMETVFAAP